MPFTLAHPAAAIPLRRWLGPGSLSALVVGSLMPDLPYFLPPTISGRQSHSLGGLVWFCLPAGLGCWVAYQLLVRPLALALLPVTISARLPPRASLPTTSVGAVGRVVAAILAGAVTHVAWDSFTHASGYAVAVLPTLRTRSFEGHGPPVFKLLQHASTFTGFALLAVWARRWYLGSSAARTVGDLLPLRAKVALLAVLTLPATAAGLVVSWGRFQGVPHTYRALQIALGRGLTAFGTVFLMILLSTALVWRIYRRPTPQADPYRSSGSSRRRGS